MSVFTLLISKSNTNISKCTINEMNYRKRMNKRKLRQIFINQLRYAYNGSPASLKWHSTMNQSASRRPMPDNKSNKICRMRLIKI